MNIISVPNPKNAIELHPAAKPSIPSVKFIALLKLITVKNERGIIKSPISKNCFTNNLFVW